MWNFDIHTDCFVICSGWDNYKCCVSLGLGCGSYTIGLCVHTMTQRDVGEVWVWSVWSSPTPPREPLCDRCSCEGKNWELKMALFLWIGNILNFLSPINRTWKHYLKPVWGWWAYTRDRREPDRLSSGEPQDDCYWKETLLSCCGSYVELPLL